MKKIFALLLLIAFSPQAFSAVAPDIRIVDGDSHVLNINSDGTVPVSSSSGGVPEGAATGEIPFVSSGIYDTDTNLTYNAATNILTVGGSSIGGTGEYIQGARSGMDLDDCGVGKIKFYARAGTSNESICLDLETTENTATYSTLTGITTLDQSAFDLKVKRITYPNSGSSWSVASRLVSLYKFEDNAASTAVDDFQNANEATASANTSTFSTASGIIGRGLAFTGSEFVTVGTGYQPTGDYAIETFLIPSGTVTSKDIMGNRSTSGNFVGIRLNTDSSGRPSCSATSTSGTSGLVTSATALVAGNTYHLVCSNDNGTLSLYVNGVSQGTPATVSGDHGTGAGSFLIASIPKTVGTKIAGTMDIVRLYNDGLSSAEVNFLYNSGSGTEASSGTSSNSIAANSTSPDVSTGKWFLTSANTGATAITGLTSPLVGSEVCIVGGSDTNSSTIADSSPFYLSASFTASQNDILCLYIQDATHFIESTRVNN